MLTAKTVSLFDGKYKVSSDGTIFSTVGKGRELIGGVRKDGYRTVMFRVDGKVIHKDVHRLIAENFIPNPEKKPEVNHIDGNKLNNKIDNLEWVTRIENLIHARDNGLTKAKINMEIANEIRRMYSTRLYSYKQLSTKFKISSAQIGNIVNNKKWCADSYNIDSRNKLAKPIICVESNQEYSGQTEAAEKLKINRCSISNVLNGKQKTAGGYTWKFV